MSGLRRAWTLNADMRLADRLRATLRMVTMKRRLRAEWKKTAKR